MSIGRISVVMLLCGCGATSQRQEFVYRDEICSPFPDGGIACDEVGDGAVMLRCASSAQCPADAPFCRVLGLFHGGDYNCNAQVLVCRDVDRNDCPHP